MQRYMIDTGTYGNGYSAEPDEDGPFVYADEAEARIAALESRIAAYEEAENRDISDAMRCEREGDFPRRSKPTTVAALESMLADRHAERVREIDAHMERVAGLEARLAQYRWRRVEDELPEVNETVVMWDGLDVEIGYRAVCGDGKLRWVEPFFDEYRQVTHWMPLPPAPKEGE